MPSSATVSVGADIKTCSIPHNSQLSLARPELISFWPRPQWGTLGKPQDTYTSHNSLLCEVKQIFASGLQSWSVELSFHTYLQCLHLYIHGDDCVPHESEVLASSQKNLETK